MRWWWFVLLLAGVALGFVLAHTLPHDWTAPLWEPRQEWIVPTPDAAPIGPGGVL